jgi:hypothetical protein
MTQPLMHEFLPMLVTCSCLTKINVCLLSKNKMVTSRIFLRNSITDDLTTLYTRLVDLGMEYHDGQVYLADVAELEGENVSAQ